MEDIIIEGRDDISISNYAYGDLSTHPRVFVVRQDHARDYGEDLSSTIAYATTLEKAVECAPVDEEYVYDILIENLVT